jgi:uncharacterized protein YdaU (DUF1376 family)
LEKAMHYYQFNIGDYVSHTAHLTNDEDLTYRRLLDLYYQTEKSFDVADLHKVARKVKSNEETVMLILHEFFEFNADDNSWHNKRADSEIKAYQSKADSARKANQIRWGSERHLKSDTTQILNNKQETINKKQEPTLELPAWLSETHWKDFVEFRKFIKKPMTEKAKHLMLSKLQKIKDNGHDPILAMNTSIANNWVDIYEPKPNTLNVINKQGFDGWLRGAK